jgi:hypothetical protein
MRTTTRRALVCAAQLVLATLATRADAQGGKVSPTGQYLATLTCGGAVADVPGPNSESYTSAGLQVWDSTAKRLSNPSIVCGQSVAVGGPGAATMQWFIFVFDKSYAQVKQCQSQPDAPVTGGRFACKASGTLSATLTLKPQ